MIRVFVGQIAIGIIALFGLCIGIDFVPENRCSQCLEDDFYARIFVDYNQLVAASLVLKPLLFPDNPHGDYLIIK